MARSPVTCSVHRARIRQEKRLMRVRVTVAVRWCAWTGTSGCSMAPHHGATAALTPSTRAFGAESTLTSSGSIRSSVTTPTAMQGAGAPAAVAPAVVHAKTRTAARRTGPGTHAHSTRSQAIPTGAASTTPTSSSPTRCAALAAAVPQVRGPTAGTRTRVRRTRGVTLARTTPPLAMTTGAGTLTTTTSRPRICAARAAVARAEAGCASSKSSTPWRRCDAQTVSCWQGREQWCLWGSQRCLVFASHGTPGCRAACSSCQSRRLMHDPKGRLACPTAQRKCWRGATRGSCV
mmetsp:Transcript_93404/g.217203  ORF Transcript_93404/g.217203 Transcript_93404/m.217203 type:complete len:291 (-) Transcript_93404:109-981(-)